MTHLNRLGRAGVCLVLAACLVSGTFLATAARGAPRSDKLVHATATANQADAEGKQVITITLRIDKGWHIYANPVGQENFPGIPTSVTVSAAKPLQSVRVEYPAGKVIKEPDGVHTYNAYEDQAVIKAFVQRAKGDTGPLEVSVKVQTCTNKSCLLPATIKLTVK